MQDKLKKLSEKWTAKKIDKNDEMGQMWMVTDDDHGFSIDVPAKSKAEAISEAIKSASISQHIRDQLGMTEDDQ